MVTVLKSWLKYPNIAGSWSYFFIALHICGNRVRPLYQKLVMCYSLISIYSKFLKQLAGDGIEAVIDCHSLEVWVFIEALEFQRIVVRASIRPFP